MKKALVFLLSTATLISCQMSEEPSTSAGGKEPFFQGEWSRSDSFGEHQSSMTSWTFRPDGTVIRSGYPPVFAQARFVIKSQEPGRAVLALGDKRGEQAEWLPDEMTVTLNQDPATPSLSVDGGPPMMRQGGSR